MNSCYSCIGYGWIKMKTTGNHIKVYSTAHAVPRLYDFHLLPLMVFLNRDHANNSSDHFAEILSRSLPPHLREALASFTIQLFSIPPTGKACSRRSSLLYPFYLLLNVYFMWRLGASCNSFVIGHEVPPTSTCRRG